MGFKKLIFLFGIILLIGTAQAHTWKFTPLDINGDVQTRQAFSYQMNYTLDSSCTNVVASFVFNISTNNLGVAVVDFNLENMTDIATHVCEYRGGILRKIHKLSDLAIRDLYARNANFSENNKRFFKTIFGIEYVKMKMEEEKIIKAS